MFRGTFADTLGVVVVVVVVAVAVAAAAAAVAAAAAAVAAWESSGTLDVEITVKLRVSSI